MANPNVTVDRDKYVGGSDLPTILGLNIKYGTTPFDLAMEKAGVRPREFNGNQFTKYGQKLEPVIREYINSLYGVNYLEDTVVDEARGYRGNTDGIDRNAEIPILEVKTFGEELDVEYYTPQCQFYMETFNQPACLLVGYKRPKDFYTGIDYTIENGDEYFNYDFDPANLVIHEIKRDSKLWEKIDSRIQVFKESVAKIKELKDNEETVDFEAEFNDTFYGSELISTSNKVALLETKLASYKDLEAEYKKAKEDLYKIFEDKGIISFDTGNVKITKVAPTSYETVSVDTAKLKENEPAIYDKYKTVKTTNRKGYILITTKDKK